jgi:hypothetical protein
MEKKLNKKDSWFAAGPSVLVQQQSLFMVACLINKSKTQTGASGEWAVHRALCDVN